MPDPTGNRRDYIDLNDFKRGLNREQASDSGQQPYDLQDAILSEYPEIRRRSGYTNLSPSITASDFSSGTILKAALFETIGFQGVFVVTVNSGSNQTHFWTVADGSTPVLRKTISSTATRADITPGWVSYDSATRQTGILVTTDVYTALMRWDDQAGAGSEDQWIKIAMFDGTAASNGGPAADGVGALGGSGFRYCATVGEYNFLAFRKAYSTTRGSPHWLWYSKLADGSRWRDIDKESDPTPEAGAAMHVPGPQGDNITGLASIAGQLAIMSRNSIQLVKISGDPTQWEIDHRANVGTTDHKSIANFQDSLIFANFNGIYRFTGYDVISLTEDQLGSYYRTLLSGYNTSWKLVGGMVNDNYILSITNDSGTYIGTLVCDLSDPASPAWSRFTNLQLNAISPAAYRRHTYGYLASGRMVNLEQMFTRNGGADTEGDGPHLLVEMRRLTPGGGSQAAVWRSIRPLFLNTSAGALTTQYSKTADPAASFTTLGSLAASGSVADSKLPLAVASPQLAVKVYDNSSSGNVVLKNIELSYKTRKRGRT